MPIIYNAQKKHVKLCFCSYVRVYVYLSYFAYITPKYVQMLEKEKKFMLKPGFRIFVHEVCDHFSIVIN